MQNAHAHSCVVNFLPILDATDCYCLFMWVFACTPITLSPHAHLSAQIYVFNIQLNSPCYVTPHCFPRLYFYKPDQIYCLYCSGELTGRDVIKNGLHLSLRSHSFSFSKYNPSFLGKWDLEEQTHMQQRFLPRLHHFSTELAHPVCHLSIMTLWIVSQSVPLSHRAAIQSVTQPNPIKWLLMNFKHALSPSSTCAMLRSPLAPSMRGLTLSARLLFTLYFCLFDMLKLFLLRVFNGIFCCFQSLCSFVVSVSHFAIFALSLSTTPQQKHERVCKVLREVLFPIYYLYPPLPPSSPFTSACQSLFLFLLPLFSHSCPICPPVFVFLFYFCVHLFLSLHLSFFSFLSSDLYLSGES